MSLSKIYKIFLSTLLLMGGILMTTGLAHAAGPTLLTPTDGSSTTNSTPTFTWAEVADALNYELQVDNNSDFSSPEINQTGINALTFTAGSALADGTYSWRIRGNFGGGTYTVYTNPAFTFTLSTATPTPTPTPSSTSSSSSSSSTPSAPGCNDIAPASAPDLFQIDKTTTTATLYFVMAKQPVNSYQIFYALDSGANKHSDKFGYSEPLWIIKRTINSLSPNSTYYFKVQGINGCNAGPLSKTISVTTDSNYKALSVSIPNPSPSPVPIVTLSPQTHEIVSNPPVQNIKAAQTCFRFLFWCF